MARTKDPAVRTALIERAAQMLRTREPITLRSLVAGTGVSTMAVYTHFGDMDGVWRALRQEGFTRLGERFGRVELTADPVRDLAGLSAAYVAHALEHPDLYRVMFDASFALEDGDAAFGTFEHLIRAAARSRDAGRLRADVVPRDVATQTWAAGHGLVSLVRPGPLPRSTLVHARPMLVALLVAAGDAPDRCRDSVAAGWDLRVPADDDEPAA
ncbi:TetR/AcrR family transcriptional regulator [Patulibacter sp. SYSU D01012]|uniref:TetR/AcrR family transcriptional regulator n=1 Tax=Patulibacter sp. SYSU D01012 TaxID=2817381 RepID=UPI001B315E8C|nr:TetR/AcrR family transcriptional regulator [Patulibacter sp. SYSU D01012]